LALPSEHSVQIALRTQQVIAHESGVTNTVDPLAGSYFVEKLTKDIANEAEEIIRKIDEMGGMIQAIEKGFVQKQIQDSAYTYQKSIEVQELVIVGVNQFKVEETLKPDLLRVDAKLGEEQIQRVQEVKKNRNNQEVTEKLANIRAAAKGEDNLMPHILEAVRAYATLGEICGILREEFGEYRESVVL